MRKIVVPALIVCFLATGCFGTFKLTQGIWKWNKGVSSNKWVQELVFLVMNIIPVYSLGAFIDVIFLNTIEFWTGSNPISSAETTLEDGRLVQLERNTNGDVTVRIGDEVSTLVHNGDQMALYGSRGELMATATPTVNGGLQIINNRGTTEIDAASLSAVATRPATLKELVAQPATASR